tara:strand:- start:2827 stop:3180 length:354 start_codon:yes stop_codon:yes gene_type:complete
MNFFDLLNGTNPAGGLRAMPSGPGYDFGSANTGMGMTMPGPNYGDGLGLKMPESVGQMPSNMTQQMKNPLAMAMMAQNMDKQSQSQNAPIQQQRLPGGSNLTYDQIMKMYGIPGLLG